MTPKEKAKELFYKYMLPIDGLHKYQMCFDTAKQCALIAVNEVMHQAENWGVVSVVGYWQQVKEEIEAL